MSNTIYPLIQRLYEIKNTHNFPIHIEEEILNDPEALEAYLQKGYTHFQSPEVLTRGKQPDYSNHQRNIFLASQQVSNNGHHQIPAEENKPLSDDKAVNKTTQKNISSRCDKVNNDGNHKVTRAVNSETHEVPLEVRKCLTIKRDESQARGKDWAMANITHGAQAASAALHSIWLGLVKAVIEPLRFIPGLFKKGLNVFYGFKLGKRGKEQFGLHLRPDDEGGMNFYQGLMYGNVASANLAKLACKIETKVNNWLLPSIGLVEPEKRNALFYLLMLPKLIWWRTRYMAYIDQRFATYFTRYLIHKPLALFGREKSKKIVEEIDETKVLTIDYIKERIKENLEIKENESVTRKVAASFKDIFSNDVDKQDKGTTCINHGMGAITGTLGTVACSIFIPLKAGVDLTHIELDDKTKKAIDFASTFGFLTQQTHYTCRFSVPELVKYRQIAERLRDPDKFAIEHRDEFEELKNERYKLFLIGLFTNSLGIMLPFTKLLNDDSLFARISKSVISETSNNSLLYFLSKRRVLEGKAKMLEMEQLEAEEKEREEIEKNGITAVGIQN